MSCMQESRPTGHDSHSFFRFESPQQNVTLEQYVGMHLNESVDVTNWKHEDGCNRIGNGKNSIRLTNVEETQFITIVVNRLVRSNSFIHMYLLYSSSCSNTDPGDLINYGNRLRDPRGHSSNFKIHSPPKT